MFDEQFCVCVERPWDTKLTPVDMAMVSCKLEQHLLAPVGVERSDEEREGATL